MERYHVLHRAADTTVANFEPFLDLLPAFVNGQGLLNIRG